MLVVVNLDPQHATTTLGLDLDALGLAPDDPYEAHDELTGATYVWYGANPTSASTPEQPAHVLHLRWMPAWTDR